jgi:hypothetical protein
MALRAFKSIHREASAEQCRTERLRRSNVAQSTRDRTA